MDATATLRGIRGPSNELAVLGASNYLAEVLRPSGSHARYQTLAVAAPPAVDSRGKLLLERSRAVRHEGDPAATVAAALAQTAALEERLAPVRIHDLGEVAEKRTRELVERDAEVLRYLVFLEEEVPGHPAEPTRTRIFTLDYHTSDCTLRIFEPTLANSGLVQGAYTKRHIASKPDTGKAYTPDDLRVGSRVCTYGRVFTVADADERTRATLSAKFGIDLGAALPVPPVLDRPVHIPPPVPRTNTVAFDMGREEDPTRGFYRRAGDTRAHFLAYGTAALKLEGEWRELGAPFADTRRFTVNYYLADDTVEILDRSSAYSSGGLFSTYLQRQRMPRLPIEAGMEALVPATTGLRLPPAEAVLAVSDAIRSGYEYSTGSTTRGKFTSPITGRPLFAPPPATPAGGDAGDAPLAMGVTAINGIPVLSARASTPAYLTAADFVCGGLISVFGKPLLLRSCDPFTVAFHLHHFGVDMREGFVEPGDKAAAASARVPLPPHIGALAVGSEEETRRNAGKLIPTYRRVRDFDRFYQLGGKALRFEACLDPARVDPEDSRRRFLISYYLEDDTLAIGELTGVKHGHGASVVRWLNRGKYRNARAPADSAATAALGLKHPVTPLPTAVAAAYDRVYGAARDKMGYTESSGAQGYGGGVFGKAERVGAGATGVESPADLGVRDATLHAMAALPRFFSVDDFAEGGVLQLAHAPTVLFHLSKADDFTRQFLAARADALAAGEGGSESDGGAAAAIDPKDVFVPENRVPVPALPLESSAAGSSSDGAGAGDDGSATVDDALHEASLVIAKVLAGVLESARLVVRQADKCGRGYAPRDLVAEALAQYGVQPPACDAAAIALVLDAYTLVPSGAATATAAGGVPALTAVAAMRPGGGSPDVPPGGRARPRTAAGAAAAGGAGSTLMLPSGKPYYASPSPIGTVEDPLAGPFLRDFAAPDYAGVAMVAYGALFDGIKAAAAKQLALQPRMEKLMSQLRSAVLSSRAHLRKVFRDLDVAGAGVVTMGEFRHLLARHNLDVGISDAQLRVLMARFPPAAPDVAGRFREPVIAWQGFVESLLDTRTLSPDELTGFLAFVRGLKDGAADGVGGERLVPQVHSHSNRASSWSVAAADPAPYLAGAPSRFSTPGAAGLRDHERSGAATPTTGAGVTATTAAAAARLASVASAAHAASTAGRGLAPPSAPAVAPPATTVGGHLLTAYSSALPLTGVGPATVAGSRLASAPPSRSGESVPGTATPPSIPLASLATAARGITLPRPATAAAATAGPVPCLPANPPPRPGTAAAAMTAAAGGASSAVDAVAALSANAGGRAILDAVRRTFNLKRYDLFRSLQLYDSTRRGVLNVPSFAAALVSAGLKLSRAQYEEMKATLTAAAAGAAAVRAGAPAVSLHEADVMVDFSAFFDAVFVA